MKHPPQLHPAHPKFRAALFYEKLMHLAEARHIDYEVGCHATAMMLASMIVGAGPDIVKQQHCVDAILAEARELVDRRIISDAGADPPPPVAG